LLKKCPRGVKSLKKMSEGDNKKLSDGGKIGKKMSEGGKIVEKMSEGGKIITKMSGGVKRRKQRPRG